MKHSRKRKRTKRKTKVKGGMMKSDFKDRNAACQAYRKQFLKKTILPSDYDMYDGTDLPETLHPVSPRQEYVNHYLNQPIFLHTKPLFQVSIQPNQFTHYQQITPHTRIECFIQSLFVLGLRDLDEGKKDVEKLRSMTYGTSYTAAVNYFQRSFGLQDGQIEHSWNPDTFLTSTLFSEKLNEFLQLELDDNFATILTIRLKSDFTLNHYVVAYKNHGIVHYLDPQNKIHTTNASDLADPTTTLTKFAVFRVNGVTTPMPLLLTTCPITFFGGI